MAKMKKIDISSTALFERLDKIAATINADPERKTSQVNFFTGETMRLAAAQLALDLAGVTDKELRGEVIDAFQRGVAGWWACNASQCRQARDKKEPTVESMSSYVKDL